MSTIFFVVLSLVLTKLFCVLGQNTRLMDKPNERSMHTVPTIRGGGVIFIGLSLMALFFLSYFKYFSLDSEYVFICSAILLAAISFFDDLYTVSTKIRFSVHCIVAGLIVFFMAPKVLDFVWFSLVNQYVISIFLFFALLWAINHFNFMDGLDGFCALQAVFLLASYALLFNIHQALLYQDFCLILISCLIGFLIFNFPPARLFMGDVGSATLGFISFGLALIAQQKYNIPIVYWFLLNALFLFDATITLFRRIINKEKWFAAHRKHAYQRLKRYGVGARSILLAQALINSVFLVGVLLVQNHKLGLGFLLFFLLGFMFFMYYLVEKLFPMHQNA